MLRLALFLGIACSLLAQPRKLLVISIDGLDTRYLKSADRLPTLRRLMAEGVAADGVAGIVPTVTWPSHTTIITGVPAEEHGILTNDQPGKPGQRWWFTSFLKGRTLWHAAREKGLKTAAVYWPVTVGAAIDYNFPEFWITRTEHEIAFAPIAEKATPGLVDKVEKAYPGFRKAHWDDDSGMQATRYLLEFEKPDLTLVHIADLDSESHEKGAFSAAAWKVLEKQDRLIGWALEKLPAQTVVAIVSDHGFENVDKVVRPKVIAGAGAEVSNGLVGAKDRATADKLRAHFTRPVDIAEVHRMAPGLRHWTAAWDTAPGEVASADTKGAATSEGNHQGTHGLWPTRANYRASFILWGPGVGRERLGGISMLALAPTFADILGVSLPAARMKPLWP